LPFKFNLQRYTVVFVERKARADEIMELLNAEGVSAAAFHGGRSQVGLDDTFHLTLLCESKHRVFDDSHVIDDSHGIDDSHVMMTATLLMTASTVHATNLTSPGSECNRNRRESARRHWRITRPGGARCWWWGGAR
jgi:hypothetical protein